MKITTAVTLFLLCSPVLGDTFKLPKETQLHEAVQVMGRAGGFDVLVTPTHDREPIAVDLTNVTAREAIDHVAKRKKLKVVEIKLDETRRVLLLLDERTPDPPPMPELPDGKRFDLTFAEPESLDDMLRACSRAGDFDFILEPHSGGHARLELHDVTPLEAVHLLARWQWLDVQTLAREGAPDLHVVSSPLVKLTSLPATSGSSPPMDLLFDEMILLSDLLEVVAEAGKMKIEVDPDARDIRYHLRVTKIRPEQALELIAAVGLFKVETGKPGEFRLVDPNRAAIEEVQRKKVTASQEAPAEFADDPLVRRLTYYLSLGLVVLEGGRVGVVSLLGSVERGWWPEIWTHAAGVGSIDGFRGRFFWIEGDGKVYGSRGSSMAIEGKEVVDEGTDNVAVSASITAIHCLKADGRIFSLCSTTSETSELIDENRDATMIAGNGDLLFKLRRDGSIAYFETSTNTWSPVEGSYFYQESPEYDSDRTRIDEIWTSWRGGVRCRKSSGRSYQLLKKKEIGFDYSWAPMDEAAAERSRGCKLSTLVRELSTSDSMSIPRNHKPE